MTMTVWLVRSDAVYTRCRQSHYDEACGRCKQWSHIYIYIVYIHMIIRNHIDTHVNMIKLCTYDIKQL